MIFSRLIQQAINFAIKVHSVDQQQMRKGTQIPYITHPLGVAMIVARVGGDDEVIAAAILHDTIEDCKPYGSVTKGMIADMFGERVARIVWDLTEQDKSLSWEERKILALDHIKDMDHDSQLVKAADTLHNLSELLDDVNTKGEDVFKSFNAPKYKIIENYQKRVQELSRVWPDNPLIQDLHHTLKSLLESNT